MPDTLQAGPDELRRNAQVSLLVHCTKREAFHTLRTVEQLGYMVGPALSLLLLLWWRLEQLQAVCDALDALLAVPSMLARRMLFPMRGSPGCSAWVSAEAEGTCLREKHALLSAKRLLRAT